MSDTVNIPSSGELGLRSHLSDRAKQPGVHTLAEVLSQPNCWQSSFNMLQEEQTLQRACRGLPAGTEWLFIGCGSSYYVAISAAASMNALTGSRAWAVPASEILRSPESTLWRNCIPIFISRSGRTTEIVQAAELLKSHPGRSLAISCVAGQPLEKLVTQAVILPAADEQSMVMTRSSSSMLLVLQSLAAVFAANSEFHGSLEKMSISAASVLQSLPARIQGFVASHKFANYVFLGQGPFFGLACESALKVMEMSVSYAQSFHTMEFRHGPKSVVSPETLLIFLLSERGYGNERDVLEEMKSLGGATLVLTNRADARVRAAADLLIELALDVPELTRLAPYLFAGQLLGLYTSLTKGLDPDAPRNLTRVVMLEEGTSS